jgi:voltage-gated potassium channel
MENDRAMKLRGIVSGVKGWIYGTVWDPDEHSTASRTFNVAMMLLITLNVLVVILETESAIVRRYGRLFEVFDTFSVAVFTVEYIARLWTCTLDPRFRHPIKGRLRFAFTAMALIDFMAILPFYLPLLRVDLRFLRSMRLFRLVRLFKLGRYSSALQTLGRVLSAKKEELLVTLFSSSIVLVIVSSLMYLLERETQPEVFSSIPAAMWWGVETLTTVGYGDMYPMTGLGKVLGGAIAILGIGMFAMPAGIIAAGFAEELRSHPKKVRVCPHCGRELDA